MKHNINNTCLVPYLIAERAIWNVLEADKNYKNSTPSEMASIVSKCTPAIVLKAETIFRNNEGFRKELLSKRNDPRYILEMYMEHWTKALIDSSRNAKLKALGKQYFII